MPFTAPKTWLFQETPTSAGLNTHIRDNLRYLKGLDGAVTLDAALTATGMVTATSPAAAWLIADGAGVNQFAGVQLLSRLSSGVQADWKLLSLGYEANSLVLLGGVTGASIERLRITVAGAITLSGGTGQALTVAQGGTARLTVATTGAVTLNAEPAQTLILAQNAVPRLTVNSNGAIEVPGALGLVDSGTPTTGVNQLDVRSASRPALYARGTGTAYAPVLCDLYSERTTASGVVLRAGSAMIADALLVNTNGNVSMSAGLTVTGGISSGVGGLATTGSLSASGAITVGGIVTSTGAASRDLIMEATGNGTFSRFRLLAKNSGGSVADWRFVCDGGDSGNFVIAGGVGGALDTRLKILTNGNVGIGAIPTPGAKLHVVGDTILDASNGGGRSCTFGAANLALEAAGTTGTITLGTAASGTGAITIGHSTRSSTLLYGSTVQLVSSGNAILKAGFSGVAQQLTLSNGAGQTAFMDCGSGNGARFLVYNGFLEVFGDAYKSSGGTAWLVSSDARVKDVEGAYAAGLTELRALRPVRYTYNGRGGSTKGASGIGLVAQDAQAVMPELVGSRSLPLDAGDDTPTDLLTLDVSALPFALINAVVELAARLEILEGTQS